MVSTGLMETVTFEGEPLALHNAVVIPAKAGIQYAAALAIEPQRLWNTWIARFRGR